MHTLPTMCTAAVRDAFSACACVDEAACSAECKLAIAQYVHCKTLVTCAGYYERTCKKNDEKNEKRKASFFFVSLKTTFFWLSVILL